jgi:hypothetical protein
MHITWMLMLNLIKFVGKCLNSQPKEEILHSHFLKNLWDHRTLKDKLLDIQEIQSLLVEFYKMENMNM